MAFKTPYDAADARRRFEVKRRQYEKLIHDAARGDSNEKKAWAARDAMQDLTRFMSDDNGERDRLYEKVTVLSQRYRDALEQGRRARQTERDQESARLRQQHRASLPDPHSYEGELYRSRNR